MRWTMVRGWMRQRRERRARKQPMGAYLLELEKEQEQEQQSTLLNRTARLLSKSPPLYITNGALIIEYNTTTSVIALITRTIISFVIIVKRDIIPLKYSIVVTLST